MSSSAAQTIGDAVLPAGAFRNQDRWPPPRKAGSMHHCPGPAIVIVVARLGGGRNRLGRRKHRRLLDVGDAKIRYKEFTSEAEKPLMILALLILYPT